ncbi:cell wall-binding repeat-containing protein [Rossellomorea vietnamensis]|uniref:cell wall-binding repeat-containing protein n=1 Tax=Rossellomorea vietnamensis TaxID=218284 RepID=UPI003CF46FE6
MRNKVAISIIAAMLLICLIPSAAGASPEERFGGDNRYETAVILSEISWQNGAEDVVLARGDEFADALASTPFAAKVDGPILLTEQDNLTRASYDEIRRLGAQKVWVMGGSNAISEEVTDQLENMPGVEVERIAGKDRVETSVKIAKRVDSTPSEAIVVNKDSFADAIAIGPYAAKKQMPIILSDKNALNSTNSSYLKNAGKTFVIGGKAVLSENVSKAVNKADRIYGENRYVTSVRIADRFFPGGDMPIIATGEKFADGLTGSLLAAKRNQPILLVQYNHADDEVKRYFYFNDVANYTVLGGYNAVHQFIYAQLVAGR